MAVFCLIWLLGTSSGQAASVIAGQNARAGETKVTGTLTATSAGMATDLKLDVVMTQVGTTKVLTKFDADLGKAMHIIAISEDFSVFLHHHVDHVIDGHGQVRIRFPKPGLYHIYVDAIPHSLGQSVLRFDLQVGDAVTAPPKTLEVGALVADAGPYQVRFETLDLKADAPTMLMLHITENGKPAKGLKPFLGVAAHVVLISADDLEYLHVHPMSLDSKTGGHAMPQMTMPGMTMPVEPAGEVPSDVMLHVAVRKPGLYKLWVQFMGGRTLYTVPFVAIAR